MAFVNHFLLCRSNLFTANYRSGIPGYLPSVNKNSKPSSATFPIKIKRWTFSKRLTACTEREGEKSQCGVVEEKLIREVTEVFCGVDINVRLSSLGGRKRRISGGLDIEAPVKRVWEIMTDYEKLPDILPNIVESRVIQDAVGDKQVEQVILLSRTFNIRSRIVVKVVEDYMKALRFLKLKSRDFEEFDGNYRFSEIENGYCRMEYSLDASPNLFFPISLVEKKILKEVPQLLANIREVALYRKMDDNGS
ncbi:hypothetical protein GpartN1_g648.t1 [Galdieria partita]|uniref:Coenzyme Q-binding protein COQ10 START domain-containing protein n=1 Tax=Galdieria partita TaxID=83374 RepID=A0A9C7UMQ8_9RHOD|nr:hypothetical protein GpartN1_g648.t1 [Galdieria partita]